MTKIITSAGWLAGALLSTTVYAIDNNKLDHFFLFLGTGGSFSSHADISVQSPFFDPAIEGYNSDLGNSELYTAGAGYNFNQLIGLNIEVTRRPSFEYNKPQTFISGIARTRYFDFDNTSIMANVLLNGLGLGWFYHWNACTIVHPIVSGGAGVAYNAVSNFHSVLQAPSATNPEQLYVSALMHDKTMASFAWQITAGLEILRAQTWGLDIGYRYFDGGRFKSNNYFAYTPPGNVNPITAPAWKGNFTTNEVFVNLRYFI